MKAMQYRHRDSARRAARRLAAALALFAACAFGQAQEAPAPRESELDQGIRYVQGLQRLYFLDIADMVLKELSAKYPEAATRTAQLQLEGDLAHGKFDEVKKRIAADEKAGKKEDVLWAMKLALADAYFTYGKHDECQAIYGSFFEHFKKKDAKGNVSLAVPASLEALYTDAAYKYAQMLLNMKKRELALDMYRIMLGTGKLPQHVARQCMAEMSEVALSLAEETEDAKKRAAYLVEVNKTCDKLLWMQDLWFGKAIVLKAHALMLQNKPEDAKQLVDRYMSTLTTIHQALVEQEKESGDPLTRVSPMAECRYLLAAMLQEKAQAIMDEAGFSANDSQKREAVLSLLLGSKDVNSGKRKGDGAYNHFLNVYLKYPESQWAADAGERAEQVRDWLVNVFGGKVDSKVTAEQTARVRTIQYRDARALFEQGQIDAARDRLTQVLNSFPDCPDAVPALGALAKCYIQKIQEESDAVLYAETVIGHLAERFCEMKDCMNIAGDELIRVAEYWGEYGRPDLRLDTYGKFFRLYPTHPSCVSYLTSFGEKAFQDKDYPHAIEFYSIVAHSYTNSPRAVDALSRIASIYEESRDFDSLMPVLDDLVARLKAQPKPTQALFATRFRKASALRSQAIEAIREASTNAAEAAKASRGLALSIRDFDALAGELATPPPSAQVDEREKAQNAKIREVSLFNKASSLLQMPAKDDATRGKMREMAVKTYEELIAAFPKGELAPAALIQIGTVHTLAKDVEKAEAALSRLRKDYPDSEQAKAALPLIADTLMKLGEREAAVARYREMFSGTGADYSDTDLLRAAAALIEAKEYDLARVALDKVLGRAKEGDASLVQARFAECRLLVARKDYAEAVAKLQAFVTDFPTLQIVIDAYSLLSQAASEAGLAEKDGDRRFDLFNASLDAMKEVRKRRTNNVEVAQCDLETGRIMARKAKAEAQFGDAEKARGYRGSALISYDNLVSVRTADPLLAQLTETAFFEQAPLLAEHGLWEKLSENCDAYLRRFPKGRYVGQFNAWKNQAKVELGGKAPAGEAPAEDEDAPAEDAEPADDDEDE